MNFKIYWVLRCFKWLTSRYHEMRSEQGSRNQRAGRLNTQSGWNDWHPGGFMLPVIPTLNSEEPFTVTTYVRLFNFKLIYIFYKHKIAIAWPG